MYYGVRKDDLRCLAYCLTSTFLGSIGTSFYSKKASTYPSITLD